MSEVKLFRLSGTALAIDIRTGHNATLRPGLVVLSEDAHTHAIEALAAEHAAEVNMNARHLRTIERLTRERDAPLAELAALKGGQEAVKKLQWPEIVGLVNEVLGCEAHEFPCARGYIGHEMTGINFNSLARIIDRVQHRHTAPPAQASALVPVSERNTGPVYEAFSKWIGAKSHADKALAVELMVDALDQYFHADDYPDPTPGASDGKESGE